MKNILLASTALVAFAGAAVADVAITGRAEMGIFSADSVGANTSVPNAIYGDPALITRGAATSGVSQFFTDIDVTFTMSGETDNGLTFGASVDLDEGGAGAAAVANNADDGGATIFISGGFGTLTMGDTDGALDWAITEAGNINNGGSIADDETSHSYYIGNGLDGRYDGQILRYDYSFGDFGVAISTEMDDSDARDDGYAIGFKYGMDMGGSAINFGLGYQIATTGARGERGVFEEVEAGTEIEVLALSVMGTFGDFAAGIMYADIDSDDAGVVGDYVQIGGGYSANGLTIHANYSVLSNAAFDAGGLDRDSYGLSVAYDLGGGAVVHAGYASGVSSDLIVDTGVNTGTLTAGDLTGNPDQTRWSLGLGLSF
jgi:outer membrane protein OmpU